MATRDAKLDAQFRGNFHRETVSEQIAERILSLIREQQLRPGDRLPAERELSVLMQASRPTIREALRSLAMMNVVELRHGSGTYVTSLDPQLLVQRFDLIFSLNDNAFFDLVEAREVIEPGTTALAAKRITDEAIAALEDIIRRSWECLRTTPSDFPTLDIAFHIRIAEVSGNALLMRIMQAIAELSTISSKRTASSLEGSPDLEGIERAIRMHEGILDALRARNAEQAQERMLHHLINVEKALRERLQRRPEKS